MFWNDFNSGLSFVREWISYFIQLTQSIGPRSGNKNELRWHKLRVKYYCAIAATESNNLALGLLLWAKQKRKSRLFTVGRSFLIIIIRPSPLLMGSIGRQPWTSTWLYFWQFSLPQSKWYSFWRARLTQLASRIALGGLFFWTPESFTRGRNGWYYSQTSEAYAISHFLLLMLSSIRLCCVLSHTTIQTAGSSTLFFLK